MKNSNAILVELNGFLFDKEELSALQVYQEINEDAKDLLLDMQEYAQLIGFCQVNPKANSILSKRLEMEGLKFKELFTSTEESYTSLKSATVPQLELKYHISNFIDETEDSPWINKSNLHRLRYQN